MAYRREEIEICRKPRPCVGRIITPKVTSLSVKNFEHAIDFHPKEKWPCKNTWYQDLRSTHIRNKKLLDLPYPLPPCCADLYNLSVDKYKHNKLKEYNLYRGIRELNYMSRPEEVIKPKEPQVEVNTQYFPECYEVSDTESSGKEDDEYYICSSGSESECSGCSLLGGGTRRRLHKVVKKNWRDLLANDNDGVCESMVKQEVEKIKRGHHGPLKLNRFIKAM